MGIGDQPPLKVDPELLSKYGNQLLSAAGDLPEAPPPFIVTGEDAISQAIAGKLPGLEGAIQDALPQLKGEASATANNVVTAAGQYADTDAQLAANYEKLQFGPADAAGGAGGTAGEAAGGGAGAMGQMGQMMSMPMQMASQAAQMPMQAMSALGQVPQGIMQGVQQIGQMAGGLGGGATGSPEAGAEKPADGAAPPQDDRRDEDDKAKQEAAAGDKAGERAPEPAPKEDPATTAVPQQSSPRHAAPDPTIDL